jgi:hypothetical protein
VPGRPPGPNMRGLYKRESRAAEVVVATGPTTMAGLKALEAHLVPIDPSNRYAMNATVYSESMAGWKPNLTAGYRRNTWRIAVPPRVWRMYERPIADFLSDRRAELMA